MVTIVRGVPKAREGQAPSLPHQCHPLAGKKAALRLGKAREPSRWIEAMATCSPVKKHIQVTATWLLPKLRDSGRSARCHHPFSHLRNAFLSLREDVAADAKPFPDDASSKTGRDDRKVQTSYKRKLS